MRAPPQGCVCVCVCVCVWVCVCVRACVRVCVRAHDPRSAAGPHNPCPPQRHGRPPQYRRARTGPHKRGPTRTRGRQRGEGGHWGLGGGGVRRDQAAGGGRRGLPLPDTRACLRRQEPPARPHAFVPALARERPLAAGSVPWTRGVRVCARAGHSTGLHLGHEGVGRHDAGVRHRDALPHTHTRTRAHTHARRARTHRARTHARRARTHARRARTQTRTCTGARTHTYTLQSGDWTRCRGGPPRCRRGLRGTSHALDARARTHTAIRCNRVSRATVIAARYRDAKRKRGSGGSVSLATPAEREREGGREGGRR